MPWEETTCMDQRVRFIVAFSGCTYSMSELAAQYGISRKTGYKWTERYGKEGVDGLKDRSRAPKSCPRQTSPEVEKLVVALRQAHPTWGPRKLLASLRKVEPDRAWPAASTVGEILKRHGLVQSRPARRRWPHPGRPAAQAPGGPNEVWTADFKGQFRLGDGRLCYPLTVADAYSRYLLEVHGLESVAGSGVWPAFVRLFREHGLPQAIRTDNGSPFASAGSVGGLTRLSVQWIKLGIRPERIQPGHPEQNGSHERMHRTLKAETTRPPAGNQAGQQQRFDQFRREYNEQRPHEALSQRTPSELYASSPRSYPEKEPSVEYPGHFAVRYVHRGGEIKWQGRYLFVSEALGGEHVGLEETDDGIWTVYFGPVRLARFDERERELYS